MVTRLNPNETWAHEYAGLSTDTKPTELVPNGSTFVEMDTQKFYAFDAANSTWIEQ